LDGRFFFGLRFALGLAERDFDGFRVVVSDEFGVAELVDERLATAREIIGIEEPHGMPRNAERSARRARFFSFWRRVQCWPSSRLRLGVVYPGSCRVRI